MWKATATLDQKAIQETVEKKKQQDDDLENWDSDPNFVNAVSEKDQRWGRQQTLPKDSTSTEPVAMEDLRSKVIANDAKVSKETWLTKAEDVKKSYGTKI